MHTKEEMRIIQEYKKSVDEDIYRFVKDIMEGDDRLNFITVAFLSKRAAQEIKTLTGKDVEGSRVVLDISAIKHILNRHVLGNPFTDMTIEDISRIGYVISNYDKIEEEERTANGYLDENGKPAPIVKISKRIDGTYYVVEAVNSSKQKKSYVITAYIKKKKQPSDP